jgi:hypothetical protein
MKLTKILLSTLSAAALAFSACSSTTTINVNTTLNNANKANTAIVNSKPAVNNAAPAANTTGSPAVNKAASSPSPASDSEATKLEGQLHVGKTGSYLFYVGKETGDFAAFCFANESEAGRAILAACKDGDQCAITAEIEEDEGCKPDPGFEGDLSGRGRITKVESVKKLSGKK